MTNDYPLLFDDDFYYSMAQDSYDCVQWMNIDRVVTSASEMQRSSKKFEELIRRGVLSIGDTLTATNTGGDGTTIVFSATVGQLFSTLSYRADNSYLSFRRSLQSIHIPYR